MPGKREFQQTLEIDACDLIAPAFSCEKVQMACEVEASAQCADSEACTFGNALYQLTIILSLLASRGFGIRMLYPLFLSNVVLPYRIACRFNDGGVRELAAV